MNRLIIMAMLLIPCVAFAQEKEVVNREFILGERAPMTVAYYGEFLVHPGIKLGFDWNLLMVEKTIEAKKRIKTIRKLLLISPSIAYYNHKDSHKGLVLTGELTWRRYSKKLFYREVSVGLGYYSKFNSGETWQTNNNGSASEIGSTSRGYFSPSISVGFGKRFMVKGSKQMDAFARINGNLLMGYDAGYLTELSMELGVRMALNWGIKRGEVKTIVKNK